jgi:phage-related protein
MPIPCDAMISLGNLKVALSASPIRTKRVLKAQFGDGYMERRADGLNPWSTTWNMETVPLVEDDWLTLEAYLEALGERPFSWQPPGSPEPLAWALEPVQWQRSTEGPLCKLRFTIKTWNGPPPQPILLGVPKLIKIEPTRIFRTVQPKVYPTRGTMYPNPHSGGFYPLRQPANHVVTIIGRNFTPNSIVLLGNTPQPFHYRNPYLLEATIDANDQVVGSHQLMVGEGRQQSNALTLTVG